MLNARIKLRHLQAFLEVARQRSFARAAESLAITQPGISKTIRELEDTLAVQLFERTPRGVSLTQAGLTLLRHAGPAVRALEEGVDAIQAVQTGSHWLRVGTLSTVESWLLPEALRRWQMSTTTERGAQVVTGTSAFLLSRLRRGELDVVVGRMTEAREIHDLSFEHLYYERLQLVVRAATRYCSNRRQVPINSAPTPGLCRRRKPRSANKSIAFLYVMGSRCQPSALRHCR